MKSNSGEATIGLVLTDERASLPVKEKLHYYSQKEL